MRSVADVVSERIVDSDVVIAHEDREVGRSKTNWKFLGIQRLLWFLKLWVVVVTGKMVDVVKIFSKLICIYICVLGVF